MTEVILIVDMYAKEGMQGEAEEFLQGLLAPSHAEEGCLLYAIHRNREDPRRLTFVERWTSTEALDLHMRTDHMQVAKGEIAKYFDSGPDIHMFDAVPGGSPSKGSIAGASAETAIMAHA